MGVQDAIKSLSLATGRLALGPLILIAVLFMGLGVAAAMIADRMMSDPEAVRSDPTVSEQAFLPPDAGIARNIDTGRAQPAWVENSARFDSAAGVPRLAIVVTDDGRDASATLRAMRMSEPLTLAIAPTVDGARARAEAARRLNREVLLYLPMESANSFDTSPNPIAGHVGRDETIRRLGWNLAQLDGYVGVTNQFGEETTRDAQTMRTVMETLQRKGLMFLDARSHPDSVASAVARRLGIAAGDRTVRLNGTDDPKTMRARLDDAALHARKWGGAIVMVPAQRNVIEVLAQWLETRERGVAIAPVTAVVQRMRTGAS